MITLSEKEYWNSMYSLVTKERQGQPAQSNSKSLIKIILGKKMLEFIHEYMLRGYADYFLWEILYKQYMPKTRGAKVLEVGSAPGDFLVRLSQLFNFVPYGVEYSPSGVALNRKTFSAYNINQDNVIHADFLSDEFQNKYKGRFDIVVSNGVIEHFTDAKDIVRKHINLLARGGYLFVMIPNFRGINYILANLFHRAFLLMHNRNIMQKSEFLRLFDEKYLTTLFCDYYGIFNFSLFNEYEAMRKFATRSMLIFCTMVQSLLNVIFRLLFRDKGVESRFFSPYLIFIGVKKE